MRLHSAFSESAPAAASAGGRTSTRRPRAWSQVGKGIAAFVAGIMIGASSIIIAELATPQPDSAIFDPGPVQLRR